MKCLKKLSVIIILLFPIYSFAAVVSDNDGAAFITKAEFDSLKNDFQSQIDVYNSSIDNKIDSAIAEYLAGVKKRSEILVNELYTIIEQAYGGEILWGSYTNNSLLNTKNDAVPCGSEHFVFYAVMNSNYIQNAAHWAMKMRVISSQFLCDGDNNDIVDYTPDISWWLHVLHAESGAYASGDPPCIYSPWSKDNSTYCYLGQHPMKLGYNYISTSTYSDRSSADSWIFDEQSYYLQMNKGINFGKNFLMLPNYDGRGRGGNAWLTNQSYDGEYRTRWDEQGNHTTVDSVTNVSGDKSHIYLSTKPWNVSTGAFDAGYSVYDGISRTHGTSNNYQFGQEEMVADVPLYLSGYSVNTRKEIFPEISKWGYGKSDALQFMWGGTSESVPLTTSLNWYAQMFMWLEGNRVSSNGKKLSELNLSKVKALTGVNCSMSTGIPIAKSENIGSVKILISAAKPGKYICYNSKIASSAAGIEFSATGSNLIDVINLPNVLKDEYIFLKYLPNDDGTLGYPMNVSEIIMTVVG